VDHKITLTIVVNSDGDGTITKQEAFEAITNFVERYEGCDMNRCSKITVKDIKN
jgi:hypothetical protein